MDSQSLSELFSLTLSVSGFAAYQDLVSWQKSPKPLPSSCPSRLAFCATESADWEEAGRSRQPVHRPEVAELGSGSHYLASKANNWGPLPGYRSCRYP